METKRLVLSCPAQEPTHQGEHAERQILKHFHDAEGCAQEVGRHQHGHSGHDNRAENSDANAEQNRRHPPDNFAVSERSGGLGKHHEDVGERIEGAGADEHVAALLDFIDQVSEDHHEEGTYAVGQDEVDAGLRTGHSEDFDVVGVAVVQEGDEEGLGEH